MAKFEQSARRAARLDVIAAQVGYSCAFCSSTNVNRQTLQCADCKTTAPRNIGAFERRDAAT